jgi:hypothetical protein
MKHENQNKKGSNMNQKYIRINSPVLIVCCAGSHANFSTLPPEQTLVRHPHPNPHHPPSFWSNFDLF